ncbi:hypothetical protein BDW71DRAFT_206436 [Aspergillus fruticulosus]
MNRVSASSSLYSIPEEITPQDHQILCNGGTSSNLERLPSRLQQSKASTTSYKNEIEDLAYEISYLKAELSWNTESKQALLQFQEEMYMVFYKIDNALAQLRARLQGAEQRYLSLWGVEATQDNNGGMI